MAIVLELGFLCGSFILVDEAAEDGSALDPGLGEVGGRMIGLRRAELAAAVGQPRQNHRRRSIRSHRHHRRHHDRLTTTTPPQPPDPARRVFRTFCIANLSVANMDILSVGAQVDGDAAGQRAGYTEGASQVCERYMKGSMAGSGLGPGGQHAPERR